MNCGDAAKGQQGVLRGERYPDPRSWFRESQRAAFSAPVSTGAYRHGDEDLGLACHGYLGSANKVLDVANMDN